MKKVLLLLASILLFSFFFFLVEGEKVNKMNVHLKGESFFEGLRIIHKKNGSQNWVLVARRADISKDGDKAHLTDIEMELKSRGITIYAEKGLYTLSSKNISIDGAITAKNSNYSITTGQVEIDSAAGLLKTGEDVHIEGRKFRLQGKGMELDNNNQKVRILKDVQATFNN